MIANMAPITRTQTGSVIADFVIQSKKIYVNSEHLLIDATHLEKNKPAKITATYIIINKDNPITTNILFIADKLYKKKISISVNNIETPYSIVSYKIPSYWKPPSTTPGIYSKKLIPYKTNLTNNSNKPKRGIHTLTNSESIQVQYNALIKKGRNVLQVSYFAMPSIRYHYGFTKYWQLGYILSPAKEWSVFKKLHIKIKLPKNWKAKTSLLSNRENDSLYLNFTKIPSDTFGMTFTMYTPFLIYLRYPIIFLLIIGLLLGIRWVTEKFSKIVVSKGKSFLWVSPIPVMLAIIALVSVFALLIFEVEYVRVLVGNQFNMNYGRGRLYIMILFPFLYATIFIILMIYTFITYKKIRRQAK